MSWLEINVETGERVEPEGLDLVGVSYRTFEGREIMVRGAGLMFPTENVLVRRSDGKRWECNAVDVWFETLKQAAGESGFAADAAEGGC